MTDVQRAAYDALQTSLDRRDHGGAAETVTAEPVAAQTVAARAAGEPGYAERNARDEANRPTAAAVSG